MRKIKAITVLAVQAALCLIVALALSFTGNAVAVGEFGISVDFESSADIDNFVYESGNGTWTISDGRLNAKNYSVMVTKDSFDTSDFGDKYVTYVSFDMYGSSAGGYMDGANDFFDFVLADKDTTVHNQLGINAIGIKMRLNAPSSYFANNLGASAWVGNVKQDIKVDALHSVLVTIKDGKAAFSIDGTVLSNYTTSETQYAVPQNFRVAFRAMSGSYIDNFKVYREINEDAILVSDKDFSKLDKFTSLNANNPVSKLSLTGDALKTATMAERDAFWSAGYNLVGAEYFAVPVNNDTEFLTGVAVDLKEGVSAADTDQGRWWTAAESREYYLESEDGSVYSGKLKSFGAYNKGYAKVPAGFKGNVILPIESFEILDWAANTLQYDKFTDDANAFNLEKAAWADVYYYPADANANVGTFSFGDPFVYGAYIPRVANSANRVITATERIGNVTAGSEKQIAFARAQYELLSADDKAQVSNLDVLTAAEQAFKTLDIVKSVYSDGKDFTGTGGVAFGEVFSQSPKTVAAWIKVDRDITDNTHIGTVIGNNYRRMVNNAVIDDSNTFSMEITTNGNPKFEWRVSRTDKTCFVVRNVDVRTGRWLHIAFTVDATAGEISCYINGELAAAKTGISPKSLADLSFRHPVMIGSDYTDEDVLALSFTPDFNGFIAQARVYTGVLSETAINGVMNGESVSGLMGGVDFISGETGEYYDYTGSNAADAFSWKAIDVEELAAKDGEFTVAVMGDTQMLLSKAVDSNGNDLYNDDYIDADNYLYKNTHWLVENKDLLNLKLVSHMGDLTDYMNYSSWATKGVRELEKGISYMDYLTTGGISWIMNRGNHDGGFTEDRLAKWDSEYSAAKYAAGVTGNYNEMRNMYYSFTVGGTEYMFVVLDLEPSDDDLAWAKGVIDANPDARVVVTTHAYMDNYANLITSTMGDSTTSNSGLKVWEKLVNVCPNVVMVLCGHADGIDISQGTFVRDDGSTVKTFMIDSSTMEFTGSRQTGVMAFMRFSADGKTVSVNYYSPTDGKLFRSINQFEFELDLSSFGSEEETDDRETYLLPDIKPYTSLDSDAIRSGQDVSCEYTTSGGQNCGSQWYVRAIALDVDKSGVFSFADNATLSFGSDYYAGIFLTKASDGTTRRIYPSSGDFATFASATIFNLNSVSSFTVKEGDRIVLISFATTAAWSASYGVRNYGGTVKSGDETLATYTFTQDINALKGYYAAGYAGVNAAGESSEIANYNGFTIGWFMPLSASMDTYYSKATLKILDESGTTVLTAKAGVRNAVLPSLVKYGYSLNGYTVSGTDYAAGDVLFSGSAASGSYTATAKFVKNEITIYDNYGDVAIKSETGISGALPQLYKSGHAFIGYKIDGALYPAGYNVDTLSGKTVVAVFARFTTFNGASMRISDPKGIRFTSYLDKNSYSVIGAENLSLGTILAHAQDIVSGTTADLSLMTLDNLDAYNLKNLPCTVSGGDGNYLVYNGAVVGIKDAAAGFAARGYMTVSYADGSYATFYSGVCDDVRSLKSVAEKALSDVCSVENDIYGNVTSGGYSMLDDETIAAIQAFANA